MQKKPVLAALASAVIALGGTACTISVPGETTTVSNTPAPTSTYETQTLEPPSQQPQGGTTEDAFIAVLDEQGIAYPDRETAVGAAEEVCGLFDEGNSFVQVLEVVSSETGMDAYKSGFFMGASVAAYCPEYTDMVG